MRNYKLLSLDESGKAPYRHPSQLFILSGVVIPEEFKLKLDRLIKRLKKRYFDNDEIIFHSRDMSRKKGPHIQGQGVRSHMIITQQLPLFLEAWQMGR